MAGFLSRLWGSGTEVSIDVADSELSRAVVHTTEAEVKAEPVRPPSDNPNRALAQTLAAFSGQGRPVTSYKDAVAADKAMNHPILLRCIDKVGLAVQSVAPYIEEDKEARPSERRAARASYMRDMADVLRSPNGNMTGPQLMYSLAIHYACTGRAVVKVGVGVDGTPNGLYPLFSPKVKAELDRYGNITKFVYGDSGSEEVIPSFHSVRKLENGRPSTSYAFQIAKPSLSPFYDIHDANTPLRALGIPAEITTNLLQRAYDSSDNTPNIRHIITTSPTMTAPQEDNLKLDIERSKTGAEQSGDFLLLRGEDVKVHPIDTGLSDIHTKIPLEDMSRLIAGAFGIPVALLGLAGIDGSKFANNYIESRLSFFQDTVIPGYLTPFETVLTKYLCIPGFRIVFDRDTIPALQESRIANAVQLSNVDFLTEDEKREMSGFEPLNRTEPRNNG